MASRAAAAMVLAGVLAVSPHTPAGAAGTKPPSAARGGGDDLASTAVAFAGGSPAPPTAVRTLPPARLRRGSWRCSRAQSRRLPSSPKSPCPSRRMRSSTRRTRTCQGRGSWR